MHVRCTCPAMAKPFYVLPCRKRVIPPSRCLPIIRRCLDRSAARALLQGRGFRRSLAAAPACHSPRIDAAMHLCKPRPASCLCSCRERCCESDVPRGRMVKACARLVRPVCMPILCLHRLRPRVGAREPCPGGRCGEGDAATAPGMAAVVVARDAHGGATAASLFNHALAPAGTRPDGQSLRSPRASAQSVPFPQRPAIALAIARFDGRSHYNRPSRSVDMTVTLVVCAPLAEACVEGRPPPTCVVDDAAPTAGGRASLRGPGGQSCGQFRTAVQKLNTPHTPRLATGDVPGSADPFVPAIVIRRMSGRRCRA